MADTRYKRRRSISLDHELTDDLRVKLREAHANKIRYIFDPRILPKDRLTLPLDSGGAKCIEILPHDLDISTKQPFAM